jgi:hypothetical protein
MRAAIAGKDDEQFPGDDDDPHDARKNSAPASLPKRSLR